MREDRENMSIDDSSQQIESENAADSPVVHTRRKFVLSATAAPVLLAVSGRSALACQTVPKGLSFAAWCSANPKGKTKGACVSHTVSGSGQTHCHPPSAWTPKSKGRCFSVRWPKDCKPFDRCQRRTYVNGRMAYDYRKWSEYRDTDEMCHYVRDLPFADAGWNSGSKLAWLDNSKSVSKILIDEQNAPGIKSEFCAAHLNALAYFSSGMYPLSTADVFDLYTKGCIGNQGYALSREQCKAFLQQLHA